MDCVMNGTMRVQYVVRLVTIQPREGNGTDGGSNKNKAYAVGGSELLTSRLFVVCLSLVAISLPSLICCQLCLLAVSGQ